MNEITVERTPVLIATEINSIKDQTRKMLLVNSIEIGRRLVEAKELVPHGEWGKWLEESVDYSKSTANNLMNIFEQYGAEQFSLFGSDAKSQVLGNLSYTQAVALLGVPAEEREQFVEENNINEMSTRELQKVIKEKQALEKQLDFNETSYRKLSKKLVKLEKELKAAKDNEKDPEEVNRLENKIQQLEDELKKKPIDVPSVVEKVPEEIEKELEELRKKASEQETDESVVKFKFHFESLVSEFKNVLGTLEQIEDQDKYKGAVKGLINKMLGAL